MANVHVLERQNGGFRLIYHIPIPVANNAAGLPYRTAIVNSKLGGTTVLTDGDGTVGTITAAEKASILSGAVVEREINLDVTQGGTLTTGPQISAYVQDNYDANSVTLRTELQNKLLHFGRTL